MNQREIKRLIVVETRQKTLIKTVDEVRDDVRDILENHLPHIREELAVNKLKIGLVTGAAAFLATFLGTRLLEAL